MQNTSDIQGYTSLKYKRSDASFIGVPSDRHRDNGQAGRLFYRKLQKGFRTSVRRNDVDNGITARKKIYAYIGYTRKPGLYKRFQFLYHFIYFFLRIVFTETKTYRYLVWIVIDSTNHMASLFCT